MTNAKKILIVNPGSTSTKIGLYDTDCMVFNESVGHSAEELIPLKPNYWQSPCQPITPAFLLQIEQGW